MVTSVTVNIDLPEVTFNALVKLSEADRKLVNTEDYIGLAWFWSFTNPQNKVLSTASTANRRKIHHEFLAQGLDLDGDSGIHRMIVHRVLDN